MNINKFIKLLVLSSFLTSFSYADITIDIKKQNNIINSSHLTTEKLKEGVITNYFENFIYISGIENGKPLVKEEPFGVKYKIIQKEEMKYLLVIYYKTENMIEVSKSKKNIIINSKQEINNIIAKFNEDNKKLLLDFETKHESFEINIGEDYSIIITHL